MICVAVFELDRIYGGPEEGGWWYTAGELKRIVKTFTDTNQAYDYSRRYNRTLAFRRHDRRRYGDSPAMRQGEWPLSSVNYNGGHYQAEVWEERPHSYPVYAPHYE